MKTRYSLIALIAALILIIAPSCRRASHNGKIDGFWKIMKMENKATGEVTEITDPKINIAINLELMQWYGIGPRLTGIISYHKGDSTIGVDFSGCPYTNEHTLAAYGFTSAKVTFDIVTLDSKHLVLATPEMIYYCDRF